MPVTVAEHCEVCPTWTDVNVHMAATEVMVAEAAVTVICADPDLVVSWVLVAVIVTGFVPGTAAGAVYWPAVEMVPLDELPPATPFTLQVTVLL